MSHKLALPHLNRLIGNAHEYMGSRKTSTFILQNILLQELQKNKFTKGSFRCYLL
jgi:hypothetical protein